MATTHLSRRRSVQRSGTRSLRRRRRSWRRRRRRLATRSTTEAMGNYQQNDADDDITIARPFCMCSYIYVCVCVSVVKIYM